MHQRIGSGFIALACLLSGGNFSAAWAEIRLERVATGLNSPTFVTQAPGDPSSLYIVQRNFQVLKYNLATRISTTVLDLSSSRFTSTGDAGAVGLAFSPDFATDHKFYLSSNSGVFNQLGVDRVEEYTLTGNSASLSRTILQYSSNTTDNNHTVDWIGFDPHATGAARDYLYITTGDGGPQANIAGYQNRSQDLTQIYGKLLRVDVSGGDDYAGDSNKNFAIPTDNPIPASGGAATGLGEIYASGFRNPFRASFDRNTGDMYIGDVGFNTKEEINFIKAGSVVGGAPPDFGWAKREGTVATPDAIAGISGAQGSSLNPIIERDHTATGQRSISGGYVYRGPITSLQTSGSQVNYFFGDEVTGHIYLSTFDNSTAPGSFNGTNGVVTDLTNSLNKLTT
ncbi:MAG TPA: PQQ-dependent sugar dehydrogenase, partial [Pirellulales bacterium]